MANQNGKTPIAGGSVVGANEHDYTFTASREEKKLPTAPVKQEEMNEEQKKLIHFARALAALNTDVFGHSLTLTGEQINEYIHSAACDGRTSLTVPNSLNYALDPMFRAEAGNASTTPKQQEAKTQDTTKEEKTTQNEEKATTATQEKKENENKKKDEEARKKAEEKEEKERKQKQERQAKLEEQRRQKAKKQGQENMKKLAANLGMTEEELSKALVS